LLPPRTRRKHTHAEGKILSLFEPSTEVRNLFGAKTELARLGTGIVDIEHPERMAFAASTFGATAGVMNDALQQGAAKNLGQTGETGGEFVTALDGLPACHL
jgi:hypothetical protein